MLTSLAVLVPIIATQTQPVQIPFKVVENAIIVDAVVNGKKVSCMFDTGFGGAFFLNENVNVGKPDGVSGVRDFVGTMEVKTTSIKSMKLGPLTIDAGDAVVMSGGNRDWSISYGTHCDGIMGLEVLKDKVFEINMEKSMFIVYPDSYDITQKKADGEKTHLVRMLPKGLNSIELSVKAHNGKKMTLALDTGNSFYATTHKDVLERIDLWKVGTKPQFARQSWVASGPVDSWDILLQDVNIYGAKVPEAVFNIIDLPSSSVDHDGTVGFQFLKNFNIIVDLKRRHVFMDNFTGQVAEPAKGDVGLYAAYFPQRKRMTIFFVMPESPADKAGIKAGDDLLGINKEFIEHVSPEKVSELLEGEPGTSVEVATSRNGALMRHNITRSILINKPITN